MFDAILRPEKRSTHNAAGAIIAVVVHVVALGVLLGMGSKPRPLPVKRAEQTVTFYVKRLPKPVSVSMPRVEAPKAEASMKRQPVKKQVLVATLTVPNDGDPISLHEKESETREPAPEVTPSTTLEANSGGSTDGAPGGFEGGAQAGAEGGESGKPKGVDVLPFGEGMKEPQLLGGDEPQYSREAIAAGVEGTMLFKCVITLDGHIERCRVIKPLPHMVTPVLTALASRRYTPVLFQGQPVTVEKLFSVKLVLPHR